MIKNLFKRNMIVIFAVAILCSAVVTYSFIRSSNSAATFTESGYVHVSSNESEDKRVLFSSGTKYKNAVNSQIRFTDVTNVDRNVSNDNFIHYDDNSIAAFCDGVIVNVDELSGDASTMNHFHISPGMVLRNTGSSYTAENSGMEIDFSDFLWKISENKYLAISKSINAHFSNEDERDCGNYVEITYLDGKVIQIQTEDNIWQTISDECALTLNDGNILDLSMKNVKDPNGNVLLDFSRIILGSEDNIELTPMSDEMESVKENVIPRFIVNNTPGDSGADGESGIEGQKGEPGNNGAKGLQGEDGLSDVAGGSAPDQFPIFKVTDWVVGPTSCKGTILVEDPSEVMANETTTLFSQLYLVDLDTGKKIYESSDPSYVPALNQYPFKEKVGTTDGVSFNFTGLKTDHSYMLYAAAPIDLKNPDTDLYVRTFVSKTFWTDSVGVHMESAYVEADNFQVAVINNNIHSGVGVYIINKPFKNYEDVSKIKLSDLQSGGEYSGRLWKIWEPDSSSSNITPETQYYKYDNSRNPTDGSLSGGDMDGAEIKSNTFYYTILAYDADGNGVIDDYSTQILATKTLKKKPSIAQPTISSNRSIWGYDVAPGLLVDNDNAVVKYTYEFYKFDALNFGPDFASTAPSALVLENTAVVAKKVDVADNSPSSISLGGAEADSYVMREILTVYDNEKEYYVISQFSNAAQLQASVQPYVYFEQRNEIQTGSSTIGNKYSKSPFYDSIVGVLHILPGEDGYKYAINENSYVEISGDSYYYSFGVKEFASVIGDTSINDGTWFPATKDGDNGAVTVQVLDYADASKSWASGLQPGTTYHISVFGDLYDSTNAGVPVIERAGVEIGHCEVTTAPSVTLTTALQSTPSDPSYIKKLRTAIATPTQLTRLGSPLIDPTGANTTTELNGFYNRELQTLYGIKISAYLGNYEDEYIWAKTEDNEVDVRKQYYIKGSSNTYTEVDPTTITTTTNPSDEGWYELKENALPTGSDQPWAFETFTRDELWKSGTAQVYMYYDTRSSAHVPDSFTYGVQVIGVIGADSAERFVLSKGGELPASASQWDYVYKSYKLNPLTSQYDDPIEYVDSTGAEVASTDPNALDNRVTKSYVSMDTSGMTLRPQYTLEKLFDSSIEKATVDGVTDYIITSGGFIFDDETFRPAGFENFTKAITGPGGALSQNKLGATFVIEELYDYTGNENDYSVTRQQHVRTLTQDLTIDGSKTYYRKDGERYASIDTALISPKTLKWYVRNTDPTTSASTPYVLSQDNAMNTGIDYYLKSEESTWLLIDTTSLNPKFLGWYEDADSYTNYFNFNGEKRIYIPFTRTIGDINLKEPFKASTSSDKKITYHERSDKYHYFYSAQANFDNANRLADTITYKVYDAVDFYNTDAYKNDDSKFIDWIVLGKDPRVTNPNDTFTDSFIIQDIQTTQLTIPEGTEYVYQQVNGVGLTVNPYLWGWYEGSPKVTTKDFNIAGGKTYYVNNGSGWTTLSSPSNGNPRSLGLFEEIIKTTTDTTFKEDQVYYAATAQGDKVEYNIVDPASLNPVGLSWYEKGAGDTKKLSNDTEVISGKEYWRYDGTNYVSVSISNSPVSLGLFFGEKQLATTNTFIDGTRYYVKLLINVRSSDEISSGGYSHYDTLISPFKKGYTETSKIPTADTTINTTKKYYSKYTGENGECYTLVDVTANENRSANPHDAGWYEENTSSKVPSLDKYYDTRKTYYNSSSAVAVNPSTNVWFEDARKTSADTQINFNKSYYKDAASTERLDPNVNPKQLGWFEVGKILTTDTTIGAGPYYAKKNTEFVKAATTVDALNPSNYGWYEEDIQASERTTVLGTDVYYAKKPNGSFIKIDTPTNPNPAALGWKLQYDNTIGDKPDATDTSMQAGTTYYVPIGIDSYVTVTSTDTINPSALGWYAAVKVISNDIKVNGTKTYYYKNDSGNFVEVDVTGALNPSALGWYVDNTTKTATLDRTINPNKDYYVSSTASTKINPNNYYNPSSLGWYEDYKKKSTDTTINTNKKYYVRYLTNPNAATPVTTEGLELASITLDMPAGAPPEINFYPCSKEYALDASHNYNVNLSENNMFLPDDTYEELYGHQFIITWTLNYHNYLNDNWHSCYPFDASAKTSAGGTTPVDTYFSTLASLSNETITNYVSGLASSSLPNGSSTKFGKNAYMAIPHNYLTLDKPKAIPASYSLLWDSGKEDTSSSTYKFVTNRSLVNDPYNAVYHYYGYEEDTSTTPSAMVETNPYTTAYLIGRSSGNDVAFALSNIQINSRKASFLNNAKAVNYIVNEANRTSDKYSISDVKVTSEKMSTSGIALPASGEGDAPVVIPVQLYSNKYVQTKQPLHAKDSNKYIVGSSDSNWKFRPTTDYKDKYASLFTGIFNADTVETSSSSQMFVRAKLYNGDIAGYYVELRAPKAAVENASAIRLRFDVYNYEDVTPSAGDSPAANKWYEVIKNKKPSENTTKESGKAYYYRGTSATGDLVFYSTETIGEFTPKNFGWYEAGPSSTYIPSDDDTIGTGPYYYLSGASYLPIDTSNYNPKALGWYEDSYSEEILSSDLTPVTGKTYRKQTDVKYSLYFDKYLPKAVTNNDYYGIIGTEVKMNEVDADGKVRMYFLIDGNDVLIDSAYGIGTGGKIFNGKDGVHISAQYLYESDVAGYSYIKFTDSSYEGDIRSTLSNRANGVINNKDFGSFAIRTYKLEPVNGYYFKSKNKAYTALTGPTVKDVSTTAYTVKAHATGGNATLNKFGSNFEVGGQSNGTMGVASLRIKIPRDRGSGNDINNEFPLNTVDIKTEVDIKADPAAADVNTAVIPSILKVGTNAKIQVHTYNSKDFVYEPGETETGNPYGLIKFPKSNMYIDFNAAAADGNSGTIVNRQTANVKYVLNNTEESSKIYATVTREPLDDCFGISIDSIESYDYASYYFDKGNETNDIYTAITKYDGANEVIPKINRKALYQTFKGTTSDLSSPEYYFNHVSDYYSVSGADYKNMFIPVSYTSNGFELRGLPYSQSVTNKSTYYVYFWVWTLINEATDGSEYGWVNIKYSSSKEFKPIKFTTGLAPNPIIDKFEISHPSYENRSLKVSLDGTADDVYYVVDLYDNVSGDLLSHLFTYSGSNLVYNPVYDSENASYVNPTDSTNPNRDLYYTLINPTADPSNPASWVPINPKQTGNKEANLRKFDLDDFVGGDGATIVKKGNSLVADATAKFLEIQSPTVDLGTFFKYGKAEGTDTSGNPVDVARYKVQLRAYFNGEGPVKNPSGYDWTNDPDSIYKVYKYTKDTATNDIKKDSLHYSTTSSGAANYTKTFSIDNDYDKVNILTTNKSFALKENNPYVQFSIESLAYGSQSVAYEKYIPLIVKYHLDESTTPVTVTKENITDEVFDDSRNASIKAARGTHGELDFSSLSNIIIDANTAADGGKFGFLQGDYVSIYLYSWQDSITKNEPVKILKTESAIISDLETELATKLTTYTDNLPDYNSANETVQSEEIAGLRMIAALNAQILPKSVKIANANVEIEGLVTDDYKDKFLDYHIKDDLNSIAKHDLIDALSTVDSDAEVLRQARALYKGYTTDTKRNEFIETQRRYQIDVMDAPESFNFTPEQTNALNLLFLKQSHIVEAKSKYDEAAIKYGYYNPDYGQPGEDPVLHPVYVYEDASSNLVVVDEGLTPLPAGAHRIEGTVDKLINAQLAFGYEDPEATINVWAIDLPDENGVNPGEPGWIPTYEKVRSDDASATGKHIITDGTYDLMIASKSVLDNASEWNYKIDMNLLDCDGATELGNMTYTIHFFKAGVQVGSSITNTTPITLTGRDSTITVTVPEPMNGGAVAEYDEIRIEYNLTEKSGGEISIVGSTGSSIVINDVKYKYEGYTVDDLKLDIDNIKIQTIDDLIDSINTSKLTTGTGNIPSPQAVATIAKANFSFK